MKKIGVFDSGIGGITVLAELKKSLCGVEYIYLGDTAHLPYGAKSPSQVEKLSVDCALDLRQKKIDALVVACNTASSLALETVRAVMDPIPVFGVVEPGVEATLEAVEALRSKHVKVPILVLATRATIRSHAYRNHFHKALGSHPSLKGLDVPFLEQACPILVPIIEEGWIDHPILHQTIAEYVRPYRPEDGPGVALLACTHYPWIHEAFERALPGWTVVNSAQAVAKSLIRSSLFSTDSGRSHSRGGHVEWNFTDPEVVPEFAKKWIKS